MDQQTDFVEEAEGLLAGGHVAEAESLLLSGLADAPNDWEWLVDRGSEREIAFWDEAEFKAYIAYFGAASGLRVTWVGPAYPKAMKLAADCASSSGRHDEATALVERAIEREPDQPKLFLALAQLRERAGREAEALALAEQAAVCRAWAPAADATAARDAAARLRVLLSTEPAQLMPPPQRRQAAKAPSFSLLDDAREVPSGVGRFLNAFEGVTARIALLVAGATAVVLLTVAAFALFRTPADEARIARFAPSLQRYLEVADAPPAPSLPYRRGRVVIVNSETKSVDPIFNSLAPSVRAETPEQVGTIVFVHWITQHVDNYYARDGQFLASAYITNCQVSVVDVASRLAVARKYFAGDAPPDKIFRVPNDRTGEFGMRPNGAVIDFVESLAPAHADAPALAIAGADPASARPVADSELYDFDFTRAFVAEGAMAPVRASGRGRAYRETLPTGESFEMVLLAGGTFGMGVPSSDGYQQDFGEPLHDVAVSPVYVGRTEVTADLWKAVAAMPKIARDLDPNPSHAAVGSLPVSAVSFADANEFCLRLGKATGRAYRLPSEAEWEYAALGGGRGPYPSGARIDPNLANVQVDPDDPDSPRGPARSGPTPVGSFGVANGFGFFDIDGNVSEWCLDAFHTSYEDAPRDSAPWLRGSEDMRRVLRGGSYATLWTEAAARKRFGFEPTVRFQYFGLRLALSAR